MPGVPVSCLSRWEFLSGHPTPSTQGLPRALLLPTLWVGQGGGALLHGFCNHSITDGLAVWGSVSRLGSLSFKMSGFWG